METSELLKFNPWWERKEAINEDKHIREFEAKEIKYTPNFQAREGGVYILRGPRQVGKTTLLKLMIREALLKSDPRALFYFSFDMCKGKDDAYSIITAYLDRFAPATERILFLDEITCVKEWYSVIKLLVDRGDIKNTDKIFLSGSNALDLWQGGEMLPGRGVEGKEHYFLPCSFRTYCSLFGMHLPKIRLNNFNQEILEKNFIKLISLNKLLSRYLETGGFMSAINGGVSEVILERYMRWIEGDIIKAGRNPVLAREVLGAVIRKKCSQFPFDAIRKETRIGSHNTVIDYLEMLDELLLTKVVEKTTISPMEVLRRKEKKCYLRDPLLLKISEKWSNATYDDGCKTESIVFEHLNRLTDVYFYNDGKREVDFVFTLGKETVGVEVKWQNNISSSDYLKLNRFDRGLLLTKETFERHGNTLLCPVSLFLGALDVGEFIKRRF